MLKVYLSGGMRREWRQQVKNLVPDLLYIDPCDSGLDRPGEYTAWDLFGVRQCDVLLAYMEKGNPSGIGLGVELGMAKALGKLTVLVDNRNDKYTAILRHTADILSDDLTSAIQFLNTLGPW